MDPTLLSALREIRLLVLDVDGVLTDGGLYYSDQGLQLKRFNSRDGLGLKLVALGGVELALLSGDPSPITQMRARRLGILHVLLGIDDKIGALEPLLEQLGLTLGQVAYMGDDLNDVPCLSAVGFGAVPRDAAPEAQTAADYVCQLGGGAGCVREVCDLLRHAQGMPIPEMFQAPTTADPVVATEFDAAP